MRLLIGSLFTVSTNLVHENNKLKLKWFFFLAIANLSNVFFAMHSLLNVVLKLEIYKIEMAHHKNDDTQLRQISYFFSIIENEN